MYRRIVTMTVTEKTAYLKGLAEGLEIDYSTKEGKLLKAIIDALDDIAVAVVDIENSCNEVRSYVEQVDDDLGELENDFYGDDYDDDEEDADYAVECPSCEETIYMDEDTADSGLIKCPNCGESLEFSFDEDDEEQCCCHGEEDEDEK